MFGFQGGESAGTVARKRGYMQDAQQRWVFMTNFDLSTIKNEIQLSSMIKERSGIASRRFAAKDASVAASASVSSPRFILISASDRCARSSTAAKRSGI